MYAHVCICRSVFLSICLSIYPSIDLSIYGRFPKFHRVFSGRDPGTLKSDIMSQKPSTINLFGFETLKFQIRRLTLWKPTVHVVMFCFKSERC